MIADILVSKWTDVWIIHVLFYFRMQIIVQFIRITLKTNIQRSLSRLFWDFFFLNIEVIFANLMKCGIWFLLLTSLIKTTNAENKSWPITPGLNVSFIIPNESLVLLDFKCFKTDRTSLSGHGGVFSFLHSWYINSHSFLSAQKCLHICCL